MTYYHHDLFGVGLYWVFGCNLTLDLKGYIAAGNALSALCQATKTNI